MRNNIASNGGSNYIKLSFQRYSNGGANALPTVFQRPSNGGAHIPPLYPPSVGRGRSDALPSNAATNIAHSLWTDFVQTSVAHRG